MAFGPYVITRRIARGGMAEIYRARRQDHDPGWVALKLMRPSPDSEDLREKLFEREARIARKLQHENIVPVFGYGVEMGRPYIAMEYMRGRDLSHLLKNDEIGRPLINVDVGLYIGLQAAKGLAYAHQLRHEDKDEDLQIVHRDVSPGNIMVGYDGEVKVLDFGVARMNETQGIRTQTGTLRGKFAYMSPEQTLGESLDARSDIFSLGIVLYELLTGHNCFRARTPLKTLERVQGLRPVPPSRANGEIPKSVDRILARCLSKNRNRRFPDAPSFADAVSEFLEQRESGCLDRLARYMSSQFAWERQAEDEELATEQDELSELVDFAEVTASGHDVYRLDAPHLRISMEEEVSSADIRSVVKSVSAIREPEVFEDPEETDDRLRAEVDVPVGNAIEEDMATERLQNPLYADTEEPHLASHAPIPHLDLSEEGTIVVSDVDDPEHPLLAATAQGPIPEPMSSEQDSRTVAVTVQTPAQPTKGNRSSFIAQVSAVAASALVLIVIVTSLISREPPPPPPPPVVKATPVRTTTPPQRFVLAVVRDAGLHDDAGVDAGVDAGLPDSGEERRRRKVRRKRKRRKRTGILNIASRPRARFKIDGKTWSKKTPQEIRLPVGRHVITLTSDRGKHKTITVIIRPDRRRSIHVDLR